MKGDDHRALTTVALDIFCANQSSGFATTIHDNRSVIIKTSELEDTSPMMERIKNWHFYKAGPELAPGEYDTNLFPKPIMVIPTSEKIIAIWIDEFAAAKGSGDEKMFCERLGRILHHIQDMSTPSHVTPVFHGIKVKDSYETHLHERIKQGLLSELPPDVASDIAAGTATGTTFMNIYTDAAVATRDHLNIPFPIKRNGSVSTLDWSLFWKRHNPASPPAPKGKALHGFGSFGPLGGGFGVTEPIEDTSSGSTYEIEREVYEGLMISMSRKAVRDTVLALLVASS